jgi:hypothetical protein
MAAGKLHTPSPRRVCSKFPAYLIVIFSKDSKTDKISSCDIS